MKYAVVFSLINALLFIGCGSDGDRRENKNDLAKLDQGIADIDMFNFIKFSWCDEKDDCTTKMIEHFNSPEKRSALNNLAERNLKRAAEKGFTKKRIAQAVADSKELSERRLFLNLSKLNMRYSKIQDTDANKDALALLYCMSTLTDINSPVCLYNTAFIYEADHEYYTCKNQCKLQNSDEKSAGYEACIKVCSEKNKEKMKDIQKS